MSEGNAKVEPMIKECPNHGGAFDCTPFCAICEGNQEYEYTEKRPCTECETLIDHDIWFEELGMCVDCSNKYFSEEE